MNRQLALRFAALSLAPLALFEGPASAQTVFDNGALNILNAPSIDIEVRDGGGPTTVDIVSGAQVGFQLNPDGTLFLDGDGDPVNSNTSRSVLVGGTSRVNLAGGVLADSLVVGEGAQAVLSAGSIGDDVSVSGNGSVELGGTAFVADDVFLSGNATWLMNGGEVNDQFFAGGDSVVTLTAAAGPINDDLFIRDNARLVMAGGSLGDELFVEDNGRAHITGGYIDDDLNAFENAVIDVDFVEVNDSVDTGGNGVINFVDGIVGGGFEAEDNSTIRIMGGLFENIFSDGEVALASGGTIEITGGTFGTAGVNDGGGVGAGLGGRLTYAGATIAGVAGGNAPRATFSGVLNGVVDIQSGEFGDLRLEAGNNGVVNVVGASADSVQVETIAGGLVRIEGLNAEALDVNAQLQSVVHIVGGLFGDADLEAVEGSVIRIFGSGFQVNGVDTGLGLVPQVAGEITGTLLDGSPFSATFRRQFFPIADAAQIVLVPEPSTSLLLLAPIVAALAGRRKKSSGNV